MLSQTRRIAAGASALGAVLALTGCSTEIDSGKAANLVTRMFNHKPKSVSCPTGVTAKKGGTFQCRATEPDGTKYVITIHMTNSSGNVEVGPNDVRQVG